MSHDSELISVSSGEGEAKASGGMEEEREDKSPLLDEVGLETPSQMISNDEVDPVCRAGRNRRGCSQLKSGLKTMPVSSLVDP